MTENCTTKCVACGRFIPYREMEDRTARFYFEPDSIKGPEISEWTCAECVAAEAARDQQTPKPLGIGAHVIVQTYGAFGLDLPYEAMVEQIKGDRVRVRPLFPVLTAGSARSSRTRKGPSIRARWVGRGAVSKCDEAFYAAKIAEFEDNTKGASASGKGSAT